MKPNAERHWYSFSLRTLLAAILLLTIPLGLAAREATIVAERKAMRQWLAEHGATATRAGTFNSFEAQDRSIPFWRRWMGDSYFASHIHIENGSAASAERIRRAFPESVVEGPVGR